MGKLIFNCGCEFPVSGINEDIYADQHKGQIPIGIDVDIYNVPPTCSRTWNLIADGNTQGIFQLEGHLGKTWARKIQPENLEELSALISLIRPGCLRALSTPSVRFTRGITLEFADEEGIPNGKKRMIVDDEKHQILKHKSNRRGQTSLWFEEGVVTIDDDDFTHFPAKSMTQQYSDRKHKLEDIEYLDKSLEPMLGNTYGVLVYQESAMQMAVTLAGFDLQQADILRKAIGKKKADIMAKVNTEFIDGCKATQVVTTEQAEEIFGWIRESQKYSFNKCLSPTTIVETKTGLKTLEEVQIGNFVKSPNGYIEVLNKYDTGIQDIYEVTLESGKHIQCTLNHKFLCEDNKKHALYEILEKDLSIMCEDGV